MTAADLAKRGAAWRRAQDRADALAFDRDAAILEALAARLTHAQIAEATGLTRGRIGQIALRSRDAR